MTPLKTIARSFDFHGRASRAEYWIYVAAQLGWWFIVGWLLSVLAAKALPEAAFAVVMKVWLAILILSFLPSIALFFRRLHDLGRRGWVWLLLSVIPPVNILIIAFFLRRGQAGANRFGKDPLGPDADEPPKVWDGEGGRYLNLEGF